MKKNFFWSMCAVVSMLFASSCSEDEIVSGVTDSDFVNATFNLETPDGIQTRATEPVIGKGKSVDKVKCVVYAVGTDATVQQPTYTLLNDLTKIEDINEVDGKSKATFQARLVKGQQYRVAFFAYNNDANAYNVDDMTNIKINSSLSNKEDRDAFTAYVDVTADETLNAITKPVTLYRPFAQLNLGSLTEDITAAGNAGIKVVKSQIKVSNVYSAFNACEDKVVGNVSEVTFNMNSIPTESLSVDDETYTYLALNYLLVGDKDTEKSLTNVEFTWETEDGKTNSPVTTFKDVPVQRNYRTNIIGYLLTNPADFNIEIDAEFQKPAYNIIIAGGTKSNPEKMEGVMDKIEEEGVKNALVTVPAGSYISWTTGDGHGSTPLIDATNTATETVTIQGEGVNSVLVVDGKGVGSLRAANGAKLIFKNITIEDKSVSYKESAWEFTYLEFAGNLEFNDVTFKGGIALQTEDNEEVLNATFTNCTFITEENDVYGVWVSDGISIFSNCKFQGTRGLKMHEDYGSEITSVTVDACEFGPLSKKPGVAIGTLNSNTTVTIKNSSFIGCQAGDQGKYIYETDTDVTSFIFEESNNSVEEDPANVVKIGTKEDLIAFQKEVNVNGNSFSGKTIKLTANIDLGKMNWEPIGQTGGNGVATHFVGTFDGQGYTISNFEIEPNSTYGKGANYATGLFGFVDAGDAVIKNLKVDKAVVKGHHWTAVICGYLTGSIQNCHVTNSTVECTHANSDACGDKAGTIVGYINNGSVKGCVAKNCTVKAGRDAGQIVGCNSKSGTVDGCTVENVTVSAIDGCTGANIKNEIIGRQN